MEQQPPNEPLFDLQVDYESGNHFNEAVKWAKFIAIVYFIGLGLSILCLALMGNLIVDKIGEIKPELQSLGGVLIGDIIVGLLIFTYTTILLYRFATLVRAGIERQDQAIFVNGLKNLKTYFLVYGVFTLLALVFNLFGAISSLI